MNIFPRFFSCFVFLLSAASLLASNNLNNVTVGEYTDFLNVVAKEDPHALYDQKMSEGDGAPVIERLGTPGNYSYSCYEDQAEASVMFVDLRSAMRFCNWKENGEQENSETTEHGVYEMEGDDLIAIHVDETTKFFLPDQKNSDALSSAELGFLNLQSLSEPDSWLRSSRVAFHLSGRLDSMMAISLSQKTKETLLITGGYTAGALGVCVGLSAVAVYLQHGCPRPRGDDAMEEDPNESRMEALANQSRSSESPRLANDELEPSSAGDARQGVASGESLFPRILSAPKKVDLLQHESEIEKINKEMAQREELVERLKEVDANGKGKKRARIELQEPFLSHAGEIQEKGEVFKNCFNKNLLKTFEHENRKQQLASSAESWAQKLKTEKERHSERSRQPRSIEVSKDHHLVKESITLKAALQKYCDDFDAGFQKAHTATETQYHLMREIQDEINWVDGAFLNLINERKAELELDLKPSINGPQNISKTNEIKNIFDKTFRKNFAEAHQQITGEFCKVAKEKIQTLLPQLEELDFCNEHLLWRANEVANQLLQLAAAEKEKLVENLNEWSSKANQDIASATRYYDALHHAWPQESDGGRAKIKDFVRRAVDKANAKNLYMAYAFKTNEEERVCLGLCVDRQFHQLSEDIKIEKGLMAQFDNISPLKNQKLDPRMAYFLEILSESPVDYIQEKATELKAKIQAMKGGGWR